MDKNLKNNTYYKRIIDKEFDLSLRAFGAANLVGVKWCGKTRVAEERAKSKMYLKDGSNKEGLIETSKINPIALLDGENPKLIDEWQKSPEIWNLIRDDLDKNYVFGKYILTGSTTPLDPKKIQHSGAGRITSIVLNLLLYGNLKNLVEKFH